MARSGMMTVRFNCDCGAVLTVPAAAGGKTVACVHCGSQLRVPMPSAGGAARTGQSCHFCGGALPRGAMACPRCGTDLRTVDREENQCRRYLRSARLAWLLPLLAGGGLLLAGLALGGRWPALAWIGGIGAILAALAGLALGAFAITGTARYGRYGILTPALLGIGLSLMAGIMALGVLPRDAVAGPQQTLAEARAGHPTKLITELNVKRSAPRPPEDVLEQVRYPSPAGGLAAYLTPDPGDGQTHPAILWLSDGFRNSIGSEAWETDDQEPAPLQVFREAGIVMMFPSFRGGNDNPGLIESFYGEVDDLLAAADFLRSRSYVDENRIYVAGHGAGGTLALLAAAYESKAFRGVLAINPVADIRTYGEDTVTFNVKDAKEADLRSPMHWLHGIQSPTIVIEVPGGITGPDELRRRLGTGRSPALTVLAAKASDPWRTLTPTARLLAAKMLADKGPKQGLKITQAELDAATK